MGIPRKVDVILHYLIKDFDNNLISEESETLTVTDQLSFTKTFYTEDLAPGSYVVAIEARYADSFAISSDTLTIVKKILPIPAAEKLVIFLLAFVASLIIIYFLLRIRKMEETKKNRQIPT